MANNDTASSAKPGSTAGTAEKYFQETHEDSEQLLQKIKEKYQRKQERLEELEEDEKKIRAAQVFTKRRYREVTAALKKGGNMVSDAALAAKNESVKLLDRAKAQTRIFNLNRKIDEHLGQLGSEIYDLVAFGGSNVFDNANVKKIIGSINECHVEIDLINKKLESEASGKDT